MDRAKDKARERAKQYVNDDCQHLNDSTKNIVKMYGLNSGDKVILINRDTLEYTTMFYQGMSKHNTGVWKMSGHEFKGNLYGKFHWNASQMYWYYEEDE